MGSRLVCEAFSKGMPGWFGVPAGQIGRVPAGAEGRASPQVRGPRPLATPHPRAESRPRVSGFM